MDNCNPRLLHNLKTCNLVHKNLIGTHEKSIIQQHTGGTIINKDVRLNCMTMLDPSTGRFEIVKVSCSELDKFTRGNG